jgi:hypothetical protein
MAQRLGVAALAAVLIGCGSANEQCLEILTSGLAPGASTNVVSTGFLCGSDVIQFVRGTTGSLMGWHDVACTSPGERDEMYRLVTWFDDGVESPFATYCADINGISCHPQPGQPSGEVTFLFPARGYTVVTVPIHAAP